MTAQLDEELGGDIEISADLFESDEAESIGFLPEASDDETEEEVEELLATAADVDLEGSELDGFESAQIDELEFVEDEQAHSIVESILFASDRPVSLASIKEVFKGTNIRKDKIKRILDTLAVDYASGSRGVTLEEITGGYQIRTKIDNMNFIKRTIKARAFKLSGPALETLSIVAYKQPVVKNEIDQIRGVESGHLLRALMEKGLCNFEGKAENLPGRPMQYGTTRRFLEIFGLRNLKELPTLSQIDELLPEGIGDDEEEKKPTLSSVTDAMSADVKEVSYSQGEEELGLIEADLQTITTSSDFFEQEKVRQKQKRDAEKAQDIRDALTMGEEVPRRDKNWLKKYEEGLALAEQGLTVPANFVEDAQNTEELQASEKNIEQIENGEEVEESEEELEFSEDAEGHKNYSTDTYELSDDEDEESPIDGELS
ncbi:SMC-Scp complex subunit ScpB [Bdellovibrio sp. qaytius]|nr:SMC-Scp complex subunit ScpB [Bdellovibrio sp. qaytius]